MIKRVSVVAVLWLLSAAVAAQSGPFVIENMQVRTQLDAYGIEEQVLVGQITNTSNEAFINVVISGEVLSASDVAIGEVFGYTVNACGVAMLDDALQPEETATFVLPIDWYIDFNGTLPIPDRFDVSADGSSIAADRDTPPDGMTGVSNISSSEVVAVEWVADDVLLYGVGCDQDIFTTYEWRRYEVETGSKVTLPEHPNAAFITDALIKATALMVPTANSNEVNPSLLNRSFLTLVPNTSRVLWQNDRNDLFSAERNGATNRRLIHQYLHQYSLRGISFTPESNLLAYFFGAYGEPVRYLTATGDGRLISQVVTINPMSNTIPGVQYDGQRVIISGTFDDVTGYFFQATRNFTRQLLFEIAPEELAGNHYPAPAYFRRDLQTRYIYIIRPIDGQAHLQCYHYEAETLHDLTPLPLQLSTDERAWSWLSPDGTKLAVAANGRHAGLWLVDLAAFEACSPFPNESSDES